MSSAPSFFYLVFWNVSTVQSPNCPVVALLSSGRLIVQWSPYCPVVALLSSGRLIVQWSPYCPVVALNWMNYSAYLFRGNYLTFCNGLRLTKSLTFRYT